MTEYLKSEMIEYIKDTEGDLVINFVDYELQDALYCQGNVLYYCSTNIMCKLVDKKLKEMTIYVNGDSDPDYIHRRCLEIIGMQMRIQLKIRYFNNRYYTFIGDIDPHYHPEIDYELVPTLTKRANYKI